VSALVLHCKCAAGGKKSVQEQICGTFERRATCGAPGNHGLRCLLVRSFGDVGGCSFHDGAYAVGRRFHVELKTQDSRFKRKA